MNALHLTGRLCETPELKQTTSGVAITTFRVAVFTPGVVGQSDFFSITAWRATAEFITRNFSKGQWIELNCHIKENNYTKNGIKIYGIEIVCDEAGFCGNRAPNLNTVHNNVAEDDELPFA